MIQWLISILLITGWWLTGNKSIWGPVVSLAGNLLWSAYAALTKQWGLIPLGIVIAAVQIRIIFKWRREN